MRLNRGRPRALPSISFLSSHVESKIGHRDRIKALGLCRIVTIEGNGVSEGQGWGGGVIARRKRLERTVERGVPKGEQGVVHILSFISPGAPPKNHTRWAGGGRS